MSFIDIGSEFQDAKEGERVPEGAYDLRCTGITMVEETVEGLKVPIAVKVGIECQNPPEGLDRPAPIFHRISLPTAADSDDTRYWKNLFTKRFLHLFQVPHEANGFDPEDISGATATNVTITHTMDDDDPELIYVNLRLPRLPDEPDEEESPRRGRRTA